MYAPQAVGEDCRLSLRRSCRSKICSRTRSSMCSSARALKSVSAALSFALASEQSTAAMGQRITTSPASTSRAAKTPSPPASGATSSCTACVHPCASSWRSRAQPSASLSAMVDPTLHTRAAPGAALYCCSQEGR
eukprot:scaffold463_cov103-Isochrysis_galbana.AAC.2